MSEGNTYELVVELLNQASLEQSGPAKIILLKQVQELILHKEPTLLDNFFDEMLSFQSDKSLDVKKFVISFLEQACKVDADILSKIIGNLNILLMDDNVNIKKKVMLSMASLYRTAVKWVSHAKVVNEVMTETWKYLSHMKEHVVTLLDDDNDGVRTHSVKFCEGAVLTLSYHSPDSEIKGDDQSLDSIPESGFLKKEDLEEDGKNIFKRMLAFLGSQSITSVNLLACMASLTNIARKRPQFLVQVIEGFESLHINLPPTLANSQVSSVRKSLKLQMLSMLKHPAASDLISQIATLLTDLGATQSEVSKAMPKPAEIAASRKRKADAAAAAGRNKKPARAEFRLPDLPAPPIVEDEDDGGETPYIGAMKPKSREAAPPVKPTKPQNAIDITTDDIIPRLTNHNVADLVLLSMVMLPDDMPAHFQSTYTPIAAAGTPGQIKHIARLLAVQLTNAGLGKGIEEQRIREKEAGGADNESAGVSTIAVVNESKLPSSGTQNQRSQFTVPMMGTSSRKMKPFDLRSSTKSLSLPENDNLTAMALQRILKAEGDASKANLSNAFCKISSNLTAQFGGSYKQILLNFILGDVKNRTDLALTWVYSEYVAYQGFTQGDVNIKHSSHGYEDCVTMLLTSLLERKDNAAAALLFTRLITDTPYIPSNAVTILKRYCTDEKHRYLGMHTLRELVLKRPVIMVQCLYALLDFTYHEKAEVRNTAIQVVKDLYENPKLTHLIDEFCKSMVNHLLQPAPTTSMFPADPKSTFDDVNQWTEMYIKQALYLYLSLLPEKPVYIDLLANTYVKANSDIKRVILRLMETPIKQMGMGSRDLLNFMKNSPKGSETLITRIMNILTERQAPTPELVQIVKVLYKERVADVRFIIPVLSGLEKSEIYAALPRLIKLNPVVVKEVFNRLLGVGGYQGQEPAITPTELMVALHQIDDDACEIKTVIKATTMCFQERTLFTQEVLAVVLNQLIETTPLPTLFMRTVIQSLTVYPKLLGFIINILQRLITKQVWKNKRVWEGFVKCCQRAKPQSFQVLLQLPAAPLKMVFDSAPDLRQPLLKHVQNLSIHQRSHIPKPVLAALEKQEVSDTPNQMPTGDASSSEEKVEQSAGSEELQAAVPEESSQPNLPPSDSDGLKGAIDASETFKPSLTADSVGPITEGNKQESTESNDEPKVESSDDRGDEMMETDQTITVVDEIKEHTTPEAAECERREEEEETLRVEQHKIPIDSIQPTEAVVLTKVSAENESKVDQPLSSASEQKNQSEETSAGDKLVEEKRSPTHIVEQNTTLEASDNAVEDKHIEKKTVDEKAAEDKTEEENFAEDKEDADHGTDEVADSEEATMREDKEESMSSMHDNSSSPSKASPTRRSRRKATTAATPPSPVATRKSTRRKK